MSQGRKIPFGFGMELRPKLKNHPKLSKLLLVLGTPVYLLYMMILGPLFPMYR